MGCVFCFTSQLAEWLEFNGLSAKTVKNNVQEQPDFSPSVVSPVLQTEVMWIAFMGYDGRVVISFETVVDN